MLLARTALARGAAVVNHCPVTALVRERGKVAGAVVRDAETGESFTLHAGCVVNATGVWVDAILAMDREPGAPARRPLVAPSQGVHLVVDREFLAGPGGTPSAAHALLVPRTADGRVLFAVPWLGKLILGTTDTPREEIAEEPAPLAAEVEFILQESARYLARAPKRADVRSVWVGLRPLVRASAMEAENTQALSREHTVAIGRSGLVTVTGGKWTTYRAMAEDVLDQCFDRALLPRRAGTPTERLPLVGAHPGRPLTRPAGRAPLRQRSGGRCASCPGPRGGSGAMATAACPRRWCASPRGTNSRATSRMCLRGAAGSSFSMRAPPRVWPMTRPRSSPTSSAAPSTPPRPAPRSSSSRSATGRFHESEGWRTPSGFHVQFRGFAKRAVTPTEQPFDASTVGRTGSAAARLA